VQDVHDGETDVEADEIGERERTHRMIHTELHNSVDAFARGHTFVKSKYCFVDHRH